MEYNNTNRIIQFKRAFFKDAECKEFSHAKDWGIGLNDSTFDMPSSNNYATYFIDLQYFEIRGKNFDYDRKHEIFCEGDIVSHISYDEKRYYEIIFSEGEFCLNNSNMCLAQSLSLLQFCEREGDIFNNKNLFK